MDEKQKLIFQFLRCGIFGGALSENSKNAVNRENLIEIYNCLHMHDLAHLVAGVLAQNGLKEREEKAYLAFKREMQLVVYRFEGMRYQFERICETLERAQIPYMPLKGAILRGYYPEDWMRTSCDIDVLVSPKHLKDATEALKKELDYREEGEHAHEISLYSEDGVHLELHYELISPDENTQHRKMLENVWDVATLKAGTQYCYELPQTYFYFYILAHTAKHFTITGGCGIRSVVDLYLYAQKHPNVKREATFLLEEGKLCKFADEIEFLGKVWLEGEESTPLADKMTEFIIKGGTYGSASNKVSALQKKEGGRFKYAMNRLFMPYSKLKIVYPVLNKHKYLYPFLTVWRLLKLLFGGTKKSTKAEIHALSHGRKQDKQIEKLFEELQVG